MRSTTNAQEFAFIHVTSLASGLNMLRKDSTFTFHKILMQVLGTFSDMLPSARLSGDHGDNKFALQDILTFV